MEPALLVFKLCKQFLSLVETYWHTEVPVKLRKGQGPGQDKAGKEHFSSRWLGLQAAEGNRLGSGKVPPFRIRR